MKRLTLLVALTCVSLSGVLGCDGQQGGYRPVVQAKPSVTNVLSHLYPAIALGFSDRSVTGPKCLNHHAVPDTSCLPQQR